jgi:Fe-S-cluster containining protein
VQHRNQPPDSTGAAELSSRDAADDSSFIEGGALCQSCGACCVFSAEWPRFTLEDDADLARIPSALVDESGRGMRCEGDRCAALIGQVGVSTSCAVYSVRPEVCRTCMPGDEACRMARQRFGL